jgi:hypothetical protein
MAAKGGRIRSDGRPPQAKGVGKNAKRHDLERPATPGLHGSDLQQGDVQEMERGQRIAPVQEQGQGAPQVARQTTERAPDGTETSSMQIPDAIDFMGNEFGGGQLGAPETGRRPFASKGETWLPILQMMASKPGTSGLLAQALIHQARRLRQLEHLNAQVVDMHDAEDSIEAMLDEGI